MTGPASRLYEMLVEHGIPERGARIYLAACREGPLTAAELARVGAIHRVEAYRFIRQLEVSGLLRAAGRRPMRFAALPPAELLDRWIRAATERLRRLEGDRDRALPEVEDGFLDVETGDPRKFTVIEGADSVARYMVRRIGTARSEIHGTVPGASLALLIEGGVFRALEQAKKRGVKIQIATEVTLSNRSDVKQLESFAELRHSPRPVTHQAWTIDREGAIVHLSEAGGPAAIGRARVALWTPSPEFRRLTREHILNLWRRSAPVDRRLVELETPDPTTIPIGGRGAPETLNRFREIAALGMRATGVTELGLPLPDMIELIGRQIGRQVAQEVVGETPEEVARSLVGYYQEHAMGRLDIAKARPLTLRVTGCFACVRQSPEIGRVLCPAMLKSVMEARLGERCEVSPPDPRRHSARGCLFTITAG